MYNLIIKHDMTNKYHKSFHVNQVSECLWEWMGNPEMNFKLSITSNSFIQTRCVFYSITHTTSRMQPICNRRKPAQCSCSWEYWLYSFQQNIWLIFPKTLEFSGTKHEMYECQVMQMSLRGTQKATQKAWTRPYSLVFLFPSLLLFSKVSFTQFIQKMLP